MARAFEVLSEALEASSARSAAVRGALVEIADWLRELAGERAPDEAHAVPESLEDRILLPQPDRRALVRADASDEVRLGRTAEPSGARAVDLGLVARRAGWKAAAVHFLCRRRAATDAAELAELRPVELALRQRQAGLPDGSAWWLDSARPLPGDALLVEIASAYEVVARAAEVLEELEAVGALDRAPPPELLYLVAEIQSALLASLLPTEQRMDHDQRDLFAWLKVQTTRHRIYVDRHMRLDDPADPHLSPQRMQRLENLRDALITQNQRRKGRARLLGKIRYHLRKAAESGAPSEHDGQTLDSVASEWRSLGLSAGDPELRRLVDEYRRASGGGELPEPLRRLLLQGAVATLEPNEAGEALSDRPPRPDPVAELATLVRGRSGMLLADHEDPELARDLRLGLGLAHLEWVVLAGDGPDLGAPLERAIRDCGDDGLVLLGRRLPLDAYAEFKRICLELKRPFVRLTGSFEPSAVAHQILRQVGWRLRG